MEHDRSKPRKTKDSFGIVFFFDDKLNGVKFQIEGVNDTKTKTRIKKSYYFWVLSSP